MFCYQVIVHGCGIRTDFVLLNGGICTLFGYIWHKKVTSIKNGNNVSVCLILFPVISKKDFHFKHLNSIVKFCHCII